MIDIVYIASLLSATLRLSVPLVFTALGEVIAERSGIVNIGLEGIMLLGAFAATYGSYYTGNPWIGIALALLVGALAGVIHALISLNFKGDQIIVGVGMNLFGYGFTSTWLIVVWGELAAHISPRVSMVPSFSFPSLRAFTLDPLIILMFIASIFAFFMLYKTKMGLRLRAVGENPSAADAAGVNVYRVRFISTVIGAALAGLGGAYMSVVWNGMFLKNMTQGRGFIALAAVVFSNWNPILALLGGLLFGFTYALVPRVSTALGVGVPPQFPQMIPYVVVLVVLAGAIVRTRPPAAIAMPYEKE